MDLPTLTSYVTIVCTLFDRFEQEQAKVRSPKRGRPYTYPEKMFVIFFINHAISTCLSVQDAVALVDSPSPAVELAGLGGTGCPIAKRLPRAVRTCLPPCSS